MTSARKTAHTEAKPELQPQPLVVIVPLPRPGGYYGIQLWQPASPRKRYLGSYKRCTANGKYAVGSDGEHYFVTAITVHESKAKLLHSALAAAFKDQRLLVALAQTLPEYNYAA